MKKRITTETHLKKKAVCTLLLCAVLACTACGPDTGSTSGPDTPQDTADDDGASQQGADSPSASEDNNSAGQAAESDTPADETDSGNPETDTSVTTYESNISIDMNMEEEQKTADDGTIYLVKTYTCPTVSIKGNDDAAEKINADIRSRIDSYMAGTDVLQWAKEGYEYHIEDMPASSFISYSEDLSFETKRADTNVISFTINYYSYTGGAHGNSDIRGVNYNARTGELISFSDLSEDSAAFHEDTLAYNQTLAKTEAYQDRLFSPESVTDGTLESVLYADDVWYLSTSGLVFMSAPYALGPYAAGTIEFIIPYTDLSGMGFKDSYAYKDRFIMKLQENETFHFDLNGDGQEDSILFHSEIAESTGESYGFLLHFTVNDTDFSQDGNDAVKEYLSDFSWGEFLLYDMNADDDYTELVVFSGENEADDYVYYSHFFRYTKDGSLLYLGRMKGDVSDPTVVISALE